MMSPDPLLELYPDLWRTKGVVLDRAVGALNGIPRAYSESSAAMWEAEERMDVGLRRLYYRELMGPTIRFDDNNGSCLGADAYEWTLIHPSAEARARAFVSTHLLAMLMKLYDEGTEHKVLLGLGEQFSAMASEAGCDYEPDHDSEAWEEKHFEELFAPLREDYKP